MKNDFLVITIFHSLMTEWFYLQSAIGCNEECFLCALWILIYFHEIKMKYALSFLD